VARRIFVLIGYRVSRLMLANPVQMYPDPWASIITPLLKENNAIAPRQTKRAKNSCTLRRNLPLRAMGNGP